MSKQLDTLKDLIPDTANVNKGSERGNYMLDWSISQLGAGRSILADADGRVIAGNKTLDAAAERDLPIRVVQTDGKELVVVQRTDLRLEGEGDERTFARQLAIADNRTSEIGYVTDAEMLLAHLNTGIDLSSMYREDELQTLLDLLATPDWDDAMTSITDQDKAPFQQMTFTVSNDQAEIINQAINKAKDFPFVDTGNDNSNGNALARIAESYYGRS